MFFPLYGAWNKGRFVFVVLCLLMALLGGGKSQSHPIVVAPDESIVVEGLVVSADVLADVSGIDREARGRKTNPVAVGADPTFQVSHESPHGARIKSHRVSVPAQFILAEGLDENAQGGLDINAEVDSVSEIHHYGGRARKTEFHISNGADPTIHVSHDGFRSALTNPVVTKRSLQLVETELLARKIRVQLEGQNYLHMREVEVWDQNGINVALYKVATQSSTAVESASKAVNGILTDMSHTSFESGKYFVRTTYQLHYNSFTPPLTLE